ncbi:hypothetical protein Taro_000328 [Colocasia esculenta]|uniref:Uncharacterized protein n=1 Tax=Colocasia esculenta TaxID=4460 RepID=A0A843TEP9_COLES|nr:hypothetical protein [Colocasia esculenta]
MRARRLVLRNRRLEEGPPSLLLRSWPVGFCIPRSPHFLPSFASFDERFALASFGTGASTSGVGELAEGTPREDVAPQDDVDYNPTFDGTPSPEGADIPRVASTETGKMRALSSGRRYLPLLFARSAWCSHAAYKPFFPDHFFAEYIPVEAAAVEGVEHLVGLRRLETRHPRYRPYMTCYCLGQRRSYPAFLTLPQAYLKGVVGCNPFTARVTNDFRPFYISVAVTSAAVLPTASPPEEGEIARGIAGDADDGAEIAAEMMESSALGTVLSPAAGTLHPPEGGDSTSLPSDTQGILEGGGWMQPLHSATNDFRPFCISVAVTSAAVLPTASPPEEGEVARGITGDADDGAEIAAEMMESSALGAVLSPAAGTLHPPEGGDSTSLPSDAQAVGGGSLPPSSSEALLERPPSFPGHGISWPDAIQRSRVHGSEGMLDFYISSARAVMEESSPPSIDVVRDFLERSTVSYHLMGCPRDPWMAAVDILWSEVAQRHEEAARHRAQELAAEVALAEQRYEALRSRRGGAVGRAESLSARHASCHADIATLRRTLEEVSSRLAEHEAASLVLAEEVAAANAEVAAVERECADSLAALSALRASLADSRRGGAV